MSTSLHLLLILLLPIIVPFAQRAYIKFRSSPQTVSRPLTKTEYWRLQIISAGCIFYAVLILRSCFAPEQNVYRITGARLSLPLDKLRARAAEKHVDIEATIWDILQLRQGVLTYIRNGSEVFTACQWCTLDRSLTYSIHSLGGILLRYLGHLSLLSSCESNKSFIVVVIASMLGLEIYTRIGGLDVYNTRDDSIGGVLFINSFACVIRQCFFLTTLLFSACKIYFGARFFSETSSVGLLRTSLIESIEQLRVSNSMNWARTDSPVLRRFEDEFWTRNKNLRTKIENDSVVASARSELATKLQYRETSQTSQMQIFVEDTVRRRFH